MDKGYTELPGGYRMDLQTGEYFDPRTGCRVSPDVIPDPEPDDVAPPAHQLPASG